mgnify:CR=1 FL=1
MQIENDKKIFKENYESYINEIQDCLKKKKEISFLHSGHTGDIILNLPVLKELAKTHTCKLFIQLDLLVPKYYEDLSSERIITMDWMNGKHLMLKYID